MKNRCLLILDLEATCDEVETDAIQGPNRETIEIGAVKLDVPSWEEVDTFQLFVRPTVNPELTPFCRGLTGISQADVDAAEPFPAVADVFLSWAGDDVDAWASWGNFDAHQWGNDARRFGREPELPWPHVNLKKAFGQALKMKRRGIGGAYAELGLDISEERHRALNDARLIARLLREVPAFGDHVRGLIA